MGRKEFLLKKRIRYMITLFFVFVLLLVSFDVIVYAVTKKALYEEIDAQMLEAEEHICENTDGALTNFLNGKEIVYYNDGTSYVVSYKIFLILRNAQGSIINEDYFVSFDYMMNIDFSPKDTGYFKVEKAERNGSTLYYRTYTIKTITKTNQEYYLQMATDSTDVELSLKIIFNILMYCTIGVMLLVLVVGWYLSKSLVKGVIDAWEKQDEFISYASHELRSPLAVIHSSLELLLETPGKKIIERSDLIMNSLTETARLRKMTNNLLEMVKLQAAEMQLDYSVVNVNEMVDCFIEPFIYQAEDMNKKLQYFVTPQIVIIGDRQLLTELMVILMENAIKYTEEGDLINVNVYTEAPNVIFEVSDSGIGINSANAMEKIFTRFYREERQQSRADGSGLGLYIASLIVQKHGGTITVERNIPKGTVFTVKIPIGTTIKNNNN